MRALLLFADGGPVTPENRERVIFNIKMYMANMGMDNQPTDQLKIE